MCVIENGEPRGELVLDLPGERNPFLMQQLDKIPPTTMRFGAGASLRGVRRQRSNKNEYASSEFTRLLCDIFILPECQIHLYIYDEREY